ncbi:MAG TPA: DUF3567 domain-containing protein [Methylibium sp.]|uniref:BTH_I0359 family protein n=1 Tax=Methylibium sp. TaxID=2067992 RepID=UPI002DB56B34|nr:DUF3567 domain-containing protein [Methylibium sp.]HEU4460360.1 DUF3567 domain-containing protein [Methylibium sp.]
MLMLYNSDHFAVVQIEVTVNPGAAEGASLTRGGYEIVDKLARKEIFIEGSLAASFREGVDALVETSPSEEEVDAFVGRYSALMQQPVVMH